MYRRGIGIQPLFAPPLLFFIASMHISSRDMNIRTVGEDASDALQLLHYHFADARIRESAIERLQSTPDDELEDFLLQLVQVCKRGAHVMSDARPNVLLNLPLFTTGASL
jgi:hypothetical protein